MLSFILPISQPPLQVIIAQSVMCFFLLYIWSCVEITNLAREFVVCWDNRSTEEREKGLWMTLICFVHRDEKGKDITDRGLLNQFTKVEEKLIDLSELKSKDYRRDMSVR